MASYWTTYKITTNFQGNTYDVDYWPEGAGQVAQGYVTDFHQFYHYITSHIDHDRDNDDDDDDKDLHFLIVAVDGESKHITDNDDLESAVQHLRNGAVLSVQALSANNRRGKARSKSKSKSKRNSKHQLYTPESEHDDTSSDEDQDDWNAKQAVNSKPVQSYSKVLSVLDHFVTHLATCHHCEETELCGRRYTYAYSTGYSMCGACYDELRADESEDWIDSGLPWDGDAPSAPLARRDDYAALDEVRHLQYLLTRLGHMQVRDTAVQTGSYQRQTERAVASFRKAYQIRGDDLTVYDKRTASKLARVVRTLRSRGHAYL